MAKQSTIASMALDEEFEEEADKELGSGRPWMNKCQFLLIQDLDTLSDFVDKAIEAGRCSLDLETEGFNNRVNKKTGLTMHKIVGICLSYHKDHGVYIPLAHIDDGAVNLPHPAVMEQIRRLYAGCEYLIFHNFKFDGAFLRVYGVVMEDFSKIHDTFLLSYVIDASRKIHGLKQLSKEFLNRPMIEIGELFKDKRMGIAFQALSPRAGLRYATSDAMNTLYLYDFLMGKMEEMDPGGRTGIRGIYDIERRCIIVTMEMERNYCLVDVPYFQRLRGEVSEQLEDLRKAIFVEAGSIFNINSLDQLGDILFNKMGIRYPIAEKNEKGGYLVNEEVLNKIKDQKIVGMILKLREREKILGTYIENFLLNVDEDGYVKFQLKQTAADTGRYSSSGGEGLHVDGYSGVNCQNIPAPDPKKKDVINIRKGIKARPGYKMVSIDYSGEELRIAANLSKEKKWVDEFLYGKGDLHSVTASVIYGTTPAEMMLEENKGKRGIGKSVNFLTLYGGGPSRLAEVAQIPLEEAKGIISKFYEGVPQLKDWLEKEGRRAKHRGYALTSFGRRRPLGFFFNDPNNRQLIQAGFRRASNGAIQGSLQSTELVLTNKGYIPVLELKHLKKKNDGILVWTGKAWSDFTVHDMGPWDLANIYLENGMELHCDTRHRVLVEREDGYSFVLYDDLKIGDRVCISSPSAVEFGEYHGEIEFKGMATKPSLKIASESDWDFLAYLVGVYLGDGVITEGKGNTNGNLRLCFGREKVEKLYPTIKEWLEGKGITVGEPQINKGSVGESYIVRIISQALLDAFDYLGVNASENAHTKKVPRPLLESPLGMRKAFLRGYWDTDGCKKRANRYSFHTPNGALLRDIQLLCGTLGLASRIQHTGEGTHRLDFSDLGAFERLMGLTEVGSMYRTMGKTRCPGWVLSQCYALFSPVMDRKNEKDMALLSKMKLGKPILVSTLNLLAVKYGIALPEMYDTFPLVRKEELGEEANTYSLFVHDAEHRYSAGGIINKNTGADVIKIALYRVWKYIRNGGYEDEVRIMMPIHDEIVFEIRADLLDKHIPQLVEVMKLKDLMQGKLKWPVPFETDAEYGDTLYVDHNYFKEKAAEAKAKALEESSTSTSLEAAVIEPSPAETAEDTLEEKDDMSLKSSSPKDLMSLEELLPPKVVASEDGVALLSNLPDSPFYDYQVSKTDAVAKRQTDTIWAVLDIMNNKGYSAGPRKRIRLIKDNMVVHKTLEEYSVDGFIALALNYII